MFDDFNSNNSESLNKTNSVNLNNKITFVVPLKSNSRYHFLCKECKDKENCYKTPLIKFRDKSVLMSCQHKKQKQSNLDDEYYDYKTILNNMPLNKLDFIKEYLFEIDDYSDIMKCKEKYENEEKEHNEPFYYYCQNFNCRKNICKICYDEHIKPS